jgi:hypothetical protein
VNEKGRRSAVVYATALNTPQPEKMVEFMDLYIEGVPIKDAWVQAGYSPNTVQNAMRAVRENWRILDKMVDERIGSHVPQALGIVVHLMTHAKSENIQLNAAKDILARAGKDRPIELKHSTSAPEDLDEDALNAEIIQLAERVHVKLNTDEEA